MKIVTNVLFTKTTPHSFAWCAQSFPGKYFQFGKLINQGCDWPQRLKVKHAGYWIEAAGRSVGQATYTIRKPWVSD